MKPEAILSNRLYVPTEYVTVEMRKRFTYRIWANKESKKACRECSGAEPDTCRGCAYAPTVVRAYKDHKDGDWTSFPRGDLGKIYEIFNDFELVDERAKVRMSARLRWREDMPLYDNQKKTLKKWLQFRYGILQSPPRSGKCVAGDTLINTDAGLIPIREIYGDHPAGVREHCIKVIGHRGVCTTSHVYKKQADRTYELCTASGYTLEGTPEHPVLTLGEDLSYVWKRLDEVSDQDRVCINRNRSLWSQQDYPGLTLDIARICGYLTANGCLHTQPRSFLFTSNNAVVREDFAGCMQRAFRYSIDWKNVNGVYTTQVNSAYIKDVLENIGLLFVSSAKKEIPFSVLRSTEGIVTAFLEAYMSCDSYLNASGIELCSASEALIRQLHVVLLNYGIVSKRISKESWARNSNTPTKRLYWHLYIDNINLNVFDSVFRLLKPSCGYNGRRYCVKDCVPNAGLCIRNVVSKFHRGSGIFVVDGVKKRMCYNRGKHAPKVDMTYDHLADIVTDTISQLDADLGERLRNIQCDRFYFDRVSSVNISEKPAFVYDLTVPGDHSFVANGLVAHNTVMFAWLAVKLQQKTLILAKQTEWLDQFITAFRDFTNVTDLEKEHGRPLIGWVKKWSDFDRYDICVLTYQSLIRHPDVVRKYRDAFGIVFVDECDQVAATCFSRVVNSFNAYYRFGCTATPRRKDQLHVVSRNILGPVTVKGYSDQMICDVRYHPTGFKIGQFAQWGTFINRICGSMTRTNFVIEKIMADVDRGRYVIAVTDRVAHAQQMARMLQNQGIEAVAFWGSMPDRKNQIQRAKDGKIQAVVAMRRIVQRGLDVKCWDSLHVVTPTANVYNYEQEVARVRTRYPNKPKPLINFYLDVGGVAHAVKAIAEKVHKTLREPETKKLKVSEIFAKKEDE